MTPPRPAPAAPAGVYLMKTRPLSEYLPATAPQERLAWLREPAEHRYLEALALGMPSPVLWVREEAAAVAYGFDSRPVLAVRLEEPFPGFAAWLRGHAWEVLETILVVCLPGAGGEPVVTRWPVIADDPTALVVQYVKALRAWFDSGEPVPKTPLGYKEFQFGGLVEDDPN